MAIRTSRGLAMLVTALLACGAEKSGDPTDAGGSPASMQPTDDPEGCVPDQVTDPRAVQCAMLGEADCDGPLGELSDCKWIATMTHAPDAATCEAPKPGAACVALEYYGDGCVGSDCDGKVIAGNVYFRTSATCEVEVSVEVFCGHRIVGWTPCALESPATEPGAPPTVEPAACKCAC